MRRSLNQALYKYLPKSWADYFESETRTSYSTFVKYWNTKELKGINKKRLIEELSYNIKSFKNRGGIIDNKFEPQNLNLSNVEVKTLRQEENKEDIRMEISPHLFFCDQCKSIQRIQKHKDVLHLKCKKDGCDGFLNQASFSYSCECGWSGPIEPIPCDEHAFTDLRYMDKDFKIQCNICYSKKDLSKWCPNCNEKLYPKPTNSGEHFFPQSIKYIELLEKNQEEFLLSDKGNKIKPEDVIIAYWLEVINKDEFQEILNTDNLLFDSNLEESEKFQKIFSKVIEYGMPEAEAKKYTMDQLNEENSTYKILTKIYNFKTENINNSFNEEIRLLNKRNSIKILEYLSIYNSPFAISYNEIIENNYRNDPAKNANKLKKISKKLGFKDIVFAKDIPLLNFSYGYTRKSPSPNKNDNNRLKLNVFNKKDPNLNVFGNKLNTEGILFTFDQYKILKWLESNDLTNNFNIINEEKLLLNWFIDNIKINKISVFQEIDDSLEITKAVYNLLHTISHGLINELSKLSGLDKNSLSEHIMPNIPAIFIYCSNEQGINLGSLETTINNNFYSLLNNAYISLQDCVFDPICINDMASCIGCTIIDEVSCEHFNKDLNRKYVIGYKDDDENIIGFWDDLNG